MEEFSWGCLELLLEMLIGKLIIVIDEDKPAVIREL